MGAASRWQGSGQKKPHLQQELAGRHTFASCGLPTKAGMQPHLHNQPAAGTWLASIGWRLRRPQHPPCLRGSLHRYL